MKPAAKPGTGTAAVTGAVGAAVAGPTGAHAAAAGGQAGTALDRPPVPPQPPNPAADPGFKAVAGAVAAGAAKAKAHPTPATEVAAASGAATAPADDTAAQAKAAQVGTMNAAQPGGFDKAAFVAAVQQAVAARAPQNLDEADKFASSGKAEGITSDVMTLVRGGKDTAAQQIQGAAEQAPDPSVATEKPVVPMTQAAPPELPKVDGAKAMPPPAPPEQTNLQAGPRAIDAQMADAQVIDRQLAASNEPQMQNALAAKKEAQAHADTAPGEIRAKEAATLQQARATASATAGAGLSGMAKDQAGLLKQVAADKTGAKGKEEAERARISAALNGIYDATKTDVDAILAGLDTKVAADFDTGASAAQAAFTAQHRAGMEEYKDKRYSGPDGWARWTADLFTGLPPEASDIFQKAKADFEAQMTKVISGIADTVAVELGRAKARIAQGRAQVDRFLAEQPKALQKVAAEAGAAIGDRFGELETTVADKQAALVDDLAGRYVEARDKVDAEIAAEQEKHKGLIDKAQDAVGGAVQAIAQLKSLFMGMLSRAADAFTRILDDPLKFITNFMNAVKDGFMNFAANILTHLKKGLMGWLLGALAEGGIELPTTFDVKGILKLVASLLGLTWANLKTRIMKMAPWIATVIDVVESKIEVFKILATEGVGGLWNWIKDKVGDLKEMILAPIKDFVVEKIIKAGITWVIGMLNPAGALIKIIQALVGVVQWITERGAGLVDLVNTVIGAVSDIAHGGTGGVPAKIEAALAKAVPLVISFLANLLGLSGISDRIKSILKAVQAPISRAIDAVIKTGLKLAGPIIRGVKEIGGKVKAKVAAGKAFVTGTGKARTTPDSAPGKQTAGDNHQRMASQAVQHLEAVQGDGAYPSLRSAMVTEAKRVEERYTKLLEPNIALSVVFGPDGETGKDIDFTVRIAPNTVEQKGKGKARSPEAAPKSAKQAADAARAAGRKTGAAAELQIRGRTFVDVSGSRLELHDDVRNALDDIPHELRAEDWHGDCAEMGCLSQALFEGVDPKGGRMRAVAIGSSNPGHGKPKKICESCKWVMRKFGVKGD